MTPNHPGGILALSELYLPLKGGHVVWLHEVCRRLAGVSLLTGAAAGRSSREEIDGVSVRRIHLQGNGRLAPGPFLVYGNMFFRGLSAAVRRRPRALLAARAIPEGFVATGIGRLLGVPSVVFAHGEEIHRAVHARGAGGRRKWTTRTKHGMMWHAFRRATRIVANSRFTAGLLADAGVPRGRVAVVHPGTDAAAFRPAPRDPGLAAQYGIGEGPVLLSVGRLTPRKGQDTVLRALPAILRARPTTVFVIAGTGEYESSLKELAGRLGVAPHVRFLGEVADGLLPRLYNLADVFLMPNRCTPAAGNVEGFGIVFLEANACEKPAIGGRSGGVPDAIVDGVTGILVDGGSPDEVAAAAIRLLDRPALAEQLGKAGRRRVLESFTWDHSAQRIAAVLDGLGAATARGRGGAAWH